MSKKISQLEILLYGTALAALTAILGMFYLDAPQCAGGYSPGDRCVIGANIGLGLAYILAIAIAAITIWIVAVNIIVNILSRNKKTGPYLETSEGRLITHLIRWGPALLLGQQLMFFISISIPTVILLAAVLIGIWAWRRKRRKSNK